MTRGSPFFITPSFFFFNDTATTDIYTLSLHDALPILLKRLFVSSHLSEVIYVWCYCWRYCFCSCTKHKSPHLRDRKSGSAGMPRPISYAVFCLKKKNVTKLLLSKVMRRLA